MARDWLESFLNLALVLAFLMGLVDWLLSPQQRARLKDKVEDWWLRLQYVEWSGLAPEDARRVGMALVRIFGPPGSRSLMIRAGIGGSSLVLVGSLLSIWLQAGGVFDHRWILWLETPLSGVGAVVALAVTMGLLETLSQTRGLARQGLVMAGSAVFALSLAFVLNLPLAIPFGLAAEVIEDQYRDGDRVRNMPPGERAGIGPEEWAYYSDGRAEANDRVMATLATLVVAVVFLPILCFLVFLTFMAFSKLARPILQPVTAFLLLRLYQSHRGILAQFASALAGLAALVKLLLA